MSCNRIFCRFKPHLEAHIWLDQPVGLLTHEHNPHLAPPIREEHKMCCAFNLGFVSTIKRWSRVDPLSFFIGFSFSLQSELRSGTRQPTNLLLALKSIWPLLLLIMFMVQIYVDSWWIHMLWFDFGVSIVISTSENKLQAIRRRFRS